MGGIMCCMRKLMMDEKQPQKKVVITGCNQNFPSESSVVLTNFRSSSAAADKKHRNSSDHNFRKVECMTLEDYLKAPSPIINTTHSRIVGGHEVQMFKHLPTKKVHPSSSPHISQEIFMPRQSFSADRLGKIEDIDKHEEADELGSMSTSRSASMKLRKKVSFKLPEAEDIFVYYTQKENI